MHRIAGITGRDNYIAIFEQDPEEIVAIMDPQVASEEVYSEMVVVR